MAGRESWHMDRIAWHRPLPKPIKMHGPVGEKKPTGQYTIGRDTVCKCGYHVCGCDRKQELFSERERKRRPGETAVDYALRLHDGKLIRATMWKDHLKQSETSLMQLHTGEWDLLISKSDFEVFNSKLNLRVKNAPPQEFKREYMGEWSKSPSKKFETDVQALLNAEEAAHRTRQWADEQARIRHDGCGHTSDRKNCCPTTIGQLKDAIEQGAKSIGRLPKDVTKVYVCEGAVAKIAPSIGVAPENGMLVYLGFRSESVQLMIAPLSPGESARVFAPSAPTSRQERVEKQLQDYSRRFYDRRF